MGNKVCFTERADPEASYNPVATTAIAEVIEEIKDGSPKAAKVQMKTMKSLSNLNEKDRDYMLNTEKWPEKQGKLLFQPEKFLAAYPKYQAEQRKLERYWKSIKIEGTFGTEEVVRKKNEVLKPEWKFILRKGAQSKDIREIILNIFGRKYSNNEIEYEAQLKTAFESIPTSFKNVPLFTHEESLEEVLKVHFLNEDGLLALKRILWAFRKSFPQLEYCPLLPRVTSLLLVYLSEAETYCVVRFMLDESVRLMDERVQYRAKEMRGMRWHFTTRKEDFEKFIQTFFETVSARSNGFNKLVKHFQKIGFDYLAMFQEWFRNIFLGYVPFPLVLQMFLGYLNEGTKIYYRMAYGLCSVLKRKLLLQNNATDMTRAIKEHSLSLDDKAIKKLILKAYSLRLKRIKNEFSKVDVSPNQIKDAKVYYRPLISQSSSIIKEETFEVIWDWIPNVSKLTDPLLLFSSYKDGYSLRNLYKKCEEYHGTPMIILIKSDHNTIFGAFIDDVFQVSSDNKYVGSSDSFVFMLHPKEIKYRATDKNNTHLLSALEYFSIGSGGDGNAIYLDHDLLNGSSYKSETYDNEQLNGKDSKLEANFKCMGLEVYVLE